MAEEVEDLTADDGQENGDGDKPLEVQLADVETELGEVKSQIEYLMQQQDRLRARREQLLRRIEQERRAPRADWRQDTFLWSGRLLRTLHDVFGLREFRPLQREVMNAVLQGRDVLCLLPSGGGKSLCYQLPALVSPGLTLVVSPLLSLIQDQVLSLRALGISGGCLTSLSSKEEVAAVYGNLDRGELKLLYVTPEKIVSSKRFMSKLEKAHQAGRLDRIAIDEAHCASQWGNDFRPDYKKLGILKQQFPRVPIMALTATATHQVCEDLKSILRISGCEFFRASVNRPNLFYAVAPKPAAAQEATVAILAWIRRHYPKGESGIVYCLTRKDSETVAAELVAGGVSARHYHADMDPGPREAAHSAWSAGTVQVMVATVAFGMGINKPDVRFVVHHSLSKSLENYYQESGRAGRDGLPARCLMFYRFSDALRQAAIVCFEPTWQPNLTAMMAYAAGGPGRGGGGGGVTCRRAIIQRHFAEAPADCRCMCDNCCASAGATLAAPRDVSRHAVAVLSILRQQQAKDKKATLIQLVDLWRGSKDAAAKEAKAMSRDENEAVIAAMMYSGLLQFEFGHTAYATNAYLRASPRGVQLLEAAESGTGPQGRVLLPPSPPAAPITAGPAPASKGKGSKQTGTQPDTPAAAAASGGIGSGSGGALRSSLEQWRTQKAQSMQVFPHSILSGEQLAALCALQLPVAEEALRQALGVRRYELYGGELGEVLSGRYEPPPLSPAKGSGGPAGGTPAAGLGASVAVATLAAAPSPTERQQPKQQQQQAKQRKRQGRTEQEPEVVTLDDSEQEEAMGPAVEEEEEDGRILTRGPGNNRRSRSRGGRRLVEDDEDEEAAGAASKGRDDVRKKRPGGTQGADEEEEEEDLQGGDDSGDEDFVSNVTLSKRRRH